MILDALTLADVEQVRQWRNLPDARPGLRTDVMLTQLQQEAWYRDVVCDRRAVHRYWAVRDDNGVLLAQAGLTDISWGDGHAEISLIVSPHARGGGVGGEAVTLVLREAFEHMRLHQVYGEVYWCNKGALEFWVGQMERHTKWRRTSPFAAAGPVVVLSDRKWWEGRFWNATYFTITAEAWTG